MTGRLPFDPARTKRGKRAGPGGEQPPGSVVRAGEDLPDGVLTITQLAARIDSAIKGGLPGRIMVVGEISSVSNRTHYYFSLKDDGAVISAVVFASTAKRMRVPPTQGDRVVAYGRLDFYAPSGRVSLIVDRIDPVGEGALERELRARVEMLRERGWLDPDEKSELPFFPRRIAVITSRDGAAVHDVIDTARRRCAAVELVIVDVRVQGERAAPEVAEAVRLVSDLAESLDIDAILVTRGGGSMEDLWAFNELVVAEAIHEASVPVVAAIGHETDVTLAELVADLRAATPTQAVMHLLPDLDAIAEELSAVQAESKAAVLRLVREERQRLEAAASRPALRDPTRALQVHREHLERVARALTACARGGVMRAERRLHRAAARLDRFRPGALHARREEMLRGLDERLTRGLRTRLRQSHDALDALHREVHAVGPMQVLARGYSVTTRGDGQIVRSNAQVRAGEELLTRLAHGQIRSTVVGGGAAPPNPPAQPAPGDAPPPRRRPRGVPQADDRTQMDLF